MARRQADGGPRTGQANKMFGGNIRDEQRSADSKPTNAAPSKKVILRSTLFAREIKTNAENDDEIDADDDKIDGGQGTVRYSQTSGKEQTCLQGALGQCQVNSTMSGEVYNRGGQGSMATEGWYI